jgi:hypothetical protein
LQPTPTDADPGVDEPQDRSKPSVFRANSSDDEQDLGGDGGSDDVCWPSRILRSVPSRIGPAISIPVYEKSAHIGKISTYRKQRATLTQVAIRRSIPARQALNAGRDHSSRAARQPFGVVPERCQHRSDDGVRRRASNRHVGYQASTSQLLVAHPPCREPILRVRLGRHGCDREA